MGVGLYLLGGSKGRGQGPTFITMQFSHNQIIKTNDWYFKPGDRSSWARKSKASAGGGLGRKSLPAQKIGVRRLGGSSHN